MLNWLQKKERRKIHTKVQTIHSSSDLIYLFGPGASQVFQKVRNWCWNWWKAFTSYFRRPNSYFQPLRFTFFWNFLVLTPFQLTWYFDLSPERTVNSIMPNLLDFSACFQFFIFNLFLRFTWIFQYFALSKWLLRWLLLSTNLCSLSFTNYIFFCHAGFVWLTFYCYSTHVAVSSNTTW